MPYTSVSKPFWTGDVWIVGGGPSASAFDFGRLRDQRVVSANCHRLADIGAAISSGGGPLAAIFSLDSNFVLDRRDFLSSYAGEKFIALPPRSFPECECVAGATYLKLSHADGLSEDPHFVRGTNSGHGALNLAFLKRASVVHLVGFDMDPADDPQYRFWARAFRATTPFFRRRSTRVLNHNLASHVDAFPKEF